MSNKSNNRYLGLANMLREGGQSTLDSDKPTTRNTNPICVSNLMKQKYRQFWQYYDLVQTCSVYEWDNLPSGLESWQLELMLYYRGSFACFKINDKFFMLPYVKRGDGITPNGMPSKIHPIPFNGKSEVGGTELFSTDYELGVDNEGIETEDPTAVICFDKIPCSQWGDLPSRAYLNSILIDEICEVFARIHLNIVVSNKKLYVECKDEKQRAVLQKEIEAQFGSDSPVIVVTQMENIGSSQSTNDYYADSLFNAIKNYDGIRCVFNGISSKGFGTDKKERLTAGELLGNESEYQHFLQNGLLMRQTFCKHINEKFGLNVSVKVSSEPTEDTTDGNGLTEDDKESQLKGGVSYE